MIKSENIPHIDEEELYTGINYVKEGIESILEYRNSGYLAAFPNKRYNQEEFILTKDLFLELLESFEIQFNTAIKLVSFFSFSIKYSPIAQFKKWIFHLSNRKFLMVSERKKEFDKDFYLLVLEGKRIFQPILCNIAHEKFLLNIYERSIIPETTTHFNLFFGDHPELILYNDYLRGKTSSMKISQKLSKNQRHNVRINYVKTDREIQYSFSIDGGRRLTHTVKLSPTKKSKILSAPIADPIKSPAKTFKSSEEYHEEVIKILKSCKRMKKETNKFANISLGRVNRIPILVNLSNRHKNRKVILNFNSKKELLVSNPEKEIIKIFTVSTSPKSNWLEKK